MQQPTSQLNLEAFCNLTGPVQEAPPSIKKVNTIEASGSAKRSHTFHYMQETSTEAYLDLKTSGGLGEKQQMVFEAFKHFGDSTDLEISKLIKLPINCVTPRRGELVELGLIIQKGLKIQPSGKMAIIWGIKHPEEVYIPKYLCKADLIKRGWTKKAIDQFLQYHDEDAENPHCPDSLNAAPMLLFSVKRVQAVEACPEFKEYIKKIKSKKAREAA